jgi:hypothetical protein
MGVSIRIAGTTVSERLYRFDQLDRLEIVCEAFDGNIGVGTFILPDPDGDTNFKGHREVYITQDDGAGAVVLFDGFIGDQGRTGIAPLHPEREHILQTADGNILMTQFRVHATRPEETIADRWRWFRDEYRVQWDDTWILDTDPVTLPAKNYGGLGFTELIADTVGCGKTAFVHSNRDPAAAFRRCLHMHRFTEGHAATISISDVTADWLGVSDVFPPIKFERREHSPIELYNDIVGRDQTGRTATVFDATSIADHNADGMEHDAIVDFEADSQEELFRLTQQYLTEHKLELQTYLVTISGLGADDMAKFNEGDLIDVTSEILGMPGTISPIRIARNRATPTKDRNGKPMFGLWDVEMTLGSPIRATRRRLQRVVTPGTVTPFVPGCAESADGFQDRLSSISGLVAYWPADDPDTQDDLADESGNNHDALMTTAGGAVLEQPPARSDTEFSVQATGSPVWEAADHADLDLVDGTLLLFIKRNSAADLTAGMVLGKGSTSSFETCPYLIRYDEASGAGTYMVQLGDNASTAAYVAITAAAIDVWQFIAFTWDGTDVKAYTHDGTGIVLVDTDAQTITPFNSSASFKIGAVVGTSTPDVSMDEIAVLNRALTIDEIEDLFCIPKVPTYGQRVCEQLTGDGTTGPYTLNFPYLAGSLTGNVTIGGVAVVVTETSPTAGTFTLAVATSATIVACYQATGGTPTGESNPSPTPASPTAGVSDHGGLTGLGDDDHTLYERTTHGGLSKVFAHGTTGATETIAPADGNVHTLTLDADCTITLTSPPATRGGAPAYSIIGLKVLQDGTGGHDITWPGSVEWPDGITPTVDTTADTLTAYEFETWDGGTTWYGHVVGAGSSASALTIEDEGTPLATAADTLDFVGPLVTATGAGAAKTITVTGALNDLTDVTISSATLDDDLRYNGSAWVNDARKWEAVTDGEDVFVWESDDLVHEWNA